jgi:perosamine synthetase
MDTTLDRVTIAYADDLYLAFPDICALPTGKLLCIYRESDAHVAGTSRIRLVESADGGRTWTDQRPLDARRSVAEDRSTWNNPHIARLPGGRLVANCDAAVYPPDVGFPGRPESLLCFQTFLWFSEDDGKTWTERQLTDTEGLCPDRVLAIRDDHWLMAIPHFSIRFPGAFRVEVAHSFDGGRTWPMSTLMAEQVGFQHDEPSIVPLAGGRLLAVMRENVHTTRPSHYVISDDEGRTWSIPRPTPFYGDRPSIGTLQSGRLLVTYRNVEPAPGETKLKVGRHPGTWAWLGDLTGLQGPGGESRYLEIEHDSCGWHGDYGYSAWTQFADGRIFCVYHHRDAAPKSRIRGCWFREEDFAGVEHRRRRCRPTPTPATRWTPDWAGTVDRAAIRTSEAIRGVPMINPIVTARPNEPDPAEIFSHLPPNRCGEVDRRYMNEVLDDGFGNKESADMLRRFESAFAAKFRVEYAISHNSGSGTLLSCLLAAGVGPGDEVIVPSCTMAATAFVVVQCGAVPVFADSDPRTFNVDPADVQRKISEFTRAIIPVSIFGLPVDFDPILSLARQHDLTIIEDDAQCFLASYKGRLVGTIGRAASFSFQGSKHMTSGGDGGMVITNEQEYATGIRKAAVQGYRTLHARPGSTMIPRDVRQDWAFERHDRLGYNFRMSAPQAALGLAQLERLDYLVAARRYIAAQYEGVIRDEKCTWLIPPYVPEGCTHSYWAYACMLDEEQLGTDWRRFRQSFIQHGGDGLYGLWLPVHLEPIFQTMAFYGSPDRAPNVDPRYKGKVKGYRTGDCPNVERFRRNVCLFKTGMQTLEKVNAQVDALRATIRYYNGGRGK